ncbi:MAG: glycosyltransferase [Paenibacillaceae bacterium]|nr:glycosyltransferase [Paenibacillaceae bacterium]
MLTSIIIVTYNKLDYTQACISSIRQYTEPGTYEIIVIDNQSGDGTRDWLLEQEDIRVILNDDNAGFPRGCNQGIELARGDYILLLNNDTIVTTHWLTNMLACFSSDDTIGAVGTVTNSCSNFQEIPVKYRDMDEMQRFAAKYNVSNPLLWEERLRLIGYNLMIRRGVMNRVGPLDEQFTPGNYEDDDLSYRIRREGFRLLLCKDTFIHHFGSVSFGEQRERFQRLLETNGRKFAAKWDFEAAHDTHIRFDIVDLIRKARNEPHRILEVGAKAGGTLMKARYHYPNAKLFGIEEREGSARSIGLFATALQGDVKMMYEMLPAGYFDVLFIHNQFHRFPDHLAVLKRARELLKPDGVLLATVPNLQQPHVLYALLDGTIRREQLAALTYAEIMGLLHEAGFADGLVTGIYNGISEKDNAVLREMNALREVGAPYHFNFSEFVVRAVNPPGGSVPAADKSLNDARIEMFERLSGVAPIEELVLK